MTIRLLGVLLMGTAAGVSLLAGAQAKFPLQRTVYIVATDPAGAHVTDLAATDLKVQDGGKEREILSVEPSKSRLKVAFVIDELLSADAAIRVAAFQSIQRIARSGDLALYLVGRRNEKLVDYTSDLLPFRDAINGFPIRPQYPGNLVESLFEIVKEQRVLEGRRVIVILAPEIPQQSFVTANGVLDQLRDNGVALYAVTLTGVSLGGGTLTEAPASRLEGGDLTSEVERDKVINDGPKQSGGLHLSLLGTEAFATALVRITSELLHQYAVTYVIPAGGKSDGRVKIETTRKGLTVRGPNLLPKV